MPVHLPFSNEKYKCIFNELYQPLCQFCYRFVLSADVAEDIVQDSYTYLWENWQRLSKIESIKSYLYTTVKNRSLKHLQSKFAKTTGLFSENEGNDRIDPDQPTAEELLEYQELQVIVERALSKLPERCRIIFVLKRYDEKTNKEIADLLNISVKTVEAQMTIAIKKMTTYVSVQWGAGVLILLNVMLKGDARKNIF
ncbi:MAG: RNA polymerase sigma-70 factor [Prolixibacteraceae bacterium]